MLHVVAALQDGGHGGLHPAGLVNARLGLKVTSGLEFQALVGAARDAGTAVEGLFEAGAKPV